MIGTLVYDAHMKRVDTSFSGLSLAGLLNDALSLGLLLRCRDGAK